MSEKIEILFFFLVGRTSAETSKRPPHLLFIGRYKVGEKDPDPKTWKANFRCAMNSLPDIEEVKDKSINKGSSAVRVYRMLPPLTKDQKKGKPSASPLGLRSFRYCA